MDTDGSPGTGPLKSLDDFAAGGLAVLTVGARGGATSVRWMKLRSLFVQSCCSNLGSIAGENKLLLCDQPGSG